jgi:hypothetical protein
MRMHFDMACINHEPLIIGLISYLLQYPFPNPLRSPPDKSTMRIAPAPISLWQVAPRRSRSKYPKHCIDKATIIFGYPSPLPPLPRQVRLYFFPGFVTNIMSLFYVGFHKMPPWYS